MGIVGHGVDVVEVARVDRLIARHGDHFLARCFTAAELEYSKGRKRSAEHLAARFAAKEAVLKALGTGLRSGILWTDIGVERGSSGEPRIGLTGRALEAAIRLGIDRWHVSLSHTGSVAIASVIAAGVSDR